jgi:Protein of unknown function (DUF3987)
VALNGSSTDASVSSSIGYIFRPLPENAAKVAAARMIPNPMSGAWCGPSLAGKTKEEPEEKPGWPEPMQPAAFHGLAGDFVSLVLPHTEADPAALLLTFLVGVGCMIGRGAWYQVEATRHGVNLFSVIVGDTSKARKGTATDRAVRMLERVDADFMASRLRSGLSSGEGLIQAVRDAREEDVPIKAKDGSALRFERQLVDSGEQDKRLLVVEAEFGSVLQQTGREGNILSTILRDCWDGRPLRILARSNKDCCQEPHISLIGNVTADELQRLLTTTDRANGFGNRILWCCARRSKLLPFGAPPIDSVKVDALAARLRQAVEPARQMGEVRFDDEAKYAWASVYEVLSQGAAGMFGSLTARAEAQTLRLAMLYALLDCSPLIRLEHLKAAQEVWGYCEDSVRCIFGDHLGDETADGILKLLRSATEGMTQTEINRALSGHKSTAEMSRALALLQGKGKLRAEQESTGGPKVTRWFVCES